MSVLADLEALRRRTRGDRHSYTFPLFLFGALILLAPLCYLSYRPPEQVTGIDRGPFPQFTTPGWLVYPDLVGWYWILTIVGGFWLTSWWYRHRARRRGIETDVRLPAAVACAALLGFLMWPTLFRVTVGSAEPAVDLAILVVAAALAAAAWLWASRRADWGHTAGLAAAAFCTAVAFGAVGTFVHRGHAALLIIAAALLVLAWVERSVRLTVVSVLFAGAAALVNLYNVENLGWAPADYWDLRVITFQVLLLPAAILLLGGAVTLIGKRR
jgi:hypothetical protein